MCGAPRGTRADTVRLRSSGTNQPTDVETNHIDIMIQRKKQDIVFDTIPLHILIPPAKNGYKEFEATDMRFLPSKTWIFRNMVTHAAWIRNKRNLGNDNLVGGLNPSEKYLSIGMIIPNIWGKNVPNHQPRYSSSWKCIPIGMEDNHRIYELDPVTYGFPASW